MLKIDHGEQTMIEINVQQISPRILKGYFYLIDDQEPWNFGNSLIDATLITLLDGEKYTDGKTIENKGIEECMTLGKEKIVQKSAKMEK